MKKIPRNVLLISSVILVTFLVLFLSFIFNTEFWALKNNPFHSSKLNILVVGYDSSINGPPRADTIILASIDLKTKEVGMLSIPRDTRAKIPGHGMNRINASHAYGGIELTDQTLESFLDVSIDYYIETDFDGFAGIIDAIGGIVINIEEPLHYTDKAGGLYINLPAGEQRLNGSKALQYVRFREEIKGDIGRIERQQKFIKAMVRRLLSPDILVKLPAIYRESKNAIKTNIPLQDISPFVHLLKDMSLGNFRTAMLPGRPEYINGASYWIPDQQELSILVNSLILSKEYIHNSQYNLAILNGNGENGLAARISDELTKYGFKISKVGNADHYNYEKTLIRYFAAKDKKTAVGIQKVLGGRIDYQDKTDDQGTGDIELIIGKDYLQKKGS